MPRDDAGGVATFAALAARLADLGYSPTPLHGKAAFLDGWQRRRDPDAAWIAEQVRAHPEANLGVVCGRVVAVDVDVLNLDLAYRLDALAVALLGEGPLRIGRWPKRLRVYRLAEPLRKLAAGCEGAKVEVLACGQQFAAYGIHPDTGRPYSWPDGDLTEWALEDLPLATPEALRRFVAEAAALLPRPEDAPARARARAAGAHGGGDGGNVVRDAEGQVVDGRDNFLSQLAYHTVWDAIARGEALDEAALAAVVFDRFCDGAVLGDAKGSGRAWSAGDALRKVRDKLRLHRAGLLPEREGDAAPATAPPFHPLPTATAEEARAEVRRHVRGFLARALAYHVAEEGAPEHAALAVEVAAGKTSIACTELSGFIAEAKARELPHRVAYLVPTHKLGGEVHGRLAGLGASVATWRGREATDPNTGEAMCANSDAVRDALAAMQDVEQAVCGKPGGTRCPFFDACAYQRQKAPATAADIVVMAHEGMLGRLPAGIGRGFGLVVADEGWWQDGVEPGRVLAVETLRAGENAHPVPRHDDPARRDDEATADLHELRRKLATAVVASPDGYLAREALLTAKLTAADCSMAGKLEWRRKVEDAMRPGMSEAARREASRRCAGNAAIPRLAALWKAAGALLDSEDAATGRVELETRDGAEGQRRVILLNTARAVAEAVTALPMLLLDATLPEALLRHRLPDLRVLATVRAAAPHMRVHQVLGGFGKTSLVPHPDAGETENRRRERRIAELRRFVAARAGGARTLAVTYEDLESRFAGLSGVELAHFNAIAGRDEWGPGPGREGVRNLLVIGRPLPAPEDVRRLAAALTGRPVPREQPGRVMRGATMRDGSGAAVPVRAYADPDLEAVRAAVTDAELLQAIGRGRGINRTEADPLDVWLLAGDAVVALPLDTMTRWQDVAPAAGPRERMAELGVVLESARDAYAAYPDLFSTARAAEDAIAREAVGAGIVTGDLARKALWRFPIGVCGLNHGRNEPPAWVRVEYRPPGRGQQTRVAWAHPSRLPELRAWLETALNCKLAHYAPDPPPPEPPMPESQLPADQPGLHPFAFGLRCVGPGAAAPMSIESGLRVRLPGHSRPPHGTWACPTSARGCCSTASPKPSRRRPQVPARVYVGYLGNVASQKDGERCCPCAPLGASPSPPFFSLVAKPIRRGARPQFR